MYSTGVLPRYEFSADQCGEVTFISRTYTVGTRRDRELPEVDQDLRDDFTDNRDEGTVIGSISTSGHQRLGMDVEGVMSVDNGALRIAPLMDAGFNRAVLAYGPFVRKPGLVFAVYMLNGHNTAQAEPLPDTFRKRFDYWFKGSETDPRWERLVQWLRSGRLRRTLRQFRRWKRTRKGGRPVPLLDENLAVGWFPTVCPLDPREEGNAFIMHALGPENGELWAGSASNRTRSLRGVQNLPLYFVAVVRAESIIYYVSSADGAVGLPPHPWLRPIAIDTRPCANELYLGIHQSVLGQIGWRIDSRVRGVRVSQISGYQTWHGGAHAADKLEHGARAGTAAEVGGKWIVAAEDGQRGFAGLTDAIGLTIAALDPGTPSDLIHAVVLCTATSCRRVGLVWRFLDPLNHWRLELAKGTCTLVFLSEGEPQVIASQDYGDSNGTPRSLQILDDGSHVMTYVDGQPISDTWIIDTRLGEATKVGIFFENCEDPSEGIRFFEAHPRRVRLPDTVDMGAPWLRKGMTEVVVDDFSRGNGDLEGRRTPIGGKLWSRTIGRGVIEMTGTGAARVHATSQERCPGRTAYCVDWSHPDFADMEVTITPPSNHADKKQQTTAGFILYQDSGNYVTLNAYRANYYPGGSVSTFFKFGGFEDIYDAVWTNVAERIAYGKPMRLRLCCDGEQYMVFIDDEPVLYRAFRDVYPDVDRLMIRKVGIIANWEFGTDTGSTFEQFRASV